MDYTKKWIDLHTHSTESDGTLTPKELMRYAKRQGLSAIALTDHDSVSGIAKARPIADELELEFIPGVELSTDYQGTEVHILGYYIDIEQTEFIRQLKEFVDTREKRNEKMALLLQQEGFDITMDALTAENPDSVITRAHFARYLVEHGFVKDRETVFAKYLGDGCKCYVPREKITPFEAIRLIQLGGGLAFFAHPVLCHMNHDRLRFFIKSLKEAGLNGLEAIYSMNAPGDERNMIKFAEEFDLLISGGSDFHGSNKPQIQLGAGKGNLRIPYEILERIKGARQNLRLQISEATDTLWHAPEHSIS
ncbi:MAG: PHP domain-containing protein [Lachnospiraceae bacterium]|nr:PHP domain-containing protein [Lachnospiraceae bacterium]